MTLSVPLIVFEHNCDHAALSRYIFKSDTDLEDSLAGRSRGRAKADDAFFRYYHDVADVTSQNDIFARRIPPGIALADDYPIAGTLTEILREYSGSGRKRRIRRPRGSSRKSVPKDTAGPGEEEVPSSTSIVLRGPRTTEAHEATSVRL